VVAARLRWDVIDNEFVDQVAQRAGLSADAVAQHDERTPGLLERLARTLAVGSPEVFIPGTGAVPADETETQIVKWTERVITEAAQTGRVVLVGRGAQAYLGTREDALHVYLVASKPFRARIAVERLRVDPATVEKTLDQVDAQRDRYVKTHYKRERQNVLNYDLVLNTERLGFEGAAEVVISEAKRRGWT
jgi:cytidylate kinase